MIRWPFGEAGPELDPCPMIPDEPSGVSSLLLQATRRFGTAGGGGRVCACGLRPAAMVPGPDIGDPDTVRGSTRRGFAPRATVGFDF